MRDCGKVQNSGLPATADPYAGLAANIPTYSCGGGYGSITNWTGTRNLSGNVVICGELRLTGNVTVNAPSGAVLIIANGRLNTNGYTIRTASGSKLTIVFTGTIGGSYLHYPSGSGTIDIAAPTSGPWSGVMMYQDPKLTTGVDISSAGTSPTWNITGLVYLPHASVTLERRGEQIDLRRELLRAGRRQYPRQGLGKHPAERRMCRRRAHHADGLGSWPRPARQLIGSRMFKRKSIRATLRNWRKDCRGVAGVEFALIGGFLCVAVVNVADIGIYLYKRMNVENAALVGAMSALKACDSNYLPATVNCPGLTAAVTAAIQSTSLGTAVTLSSAVSEGYYCVNASNALQYVSSVASKPANCSAAGMPALQPADYVQVAVTFSYTPIFAGLSVAGLFPTPITKTAMVRML